ncbi:hypothetical protein ANO14919_089200 [Xylariales sp. No.14919]|nr:hypothetical protein ANO14919_089200 [Xylariales sp. No.14919]
MADTIQGSGLTIAHNALAALVEDPERLDRMRGRFSDSPPSYRSRESGTPTRTNSSSNPPTSVQERYRLRETELYRDHRASFPSNQFDTQIRELADELYEREYPDRSWGMPADRIPHYRARAATIITKRWVDQGIWKDEWREAGPYGNWKHEEPLQFDGEVEAQHRGLFGTIREEPAQIEKRAQVEKERNASRPYYQFLWQMSHERQRVQDEMGVDLCSVELDLADVNTKAYECVKNDWMKRGYWHHKWGILPGMWWKHERPLRDLKGEDPVYTELGRLMAEARANRVGDERPSLVPRVNLFDRPNLFPGSPRISQHSYEDRSPSGGSQPDLFQGFSPVSRHSYEGRLPLDQGYPAQNGPGSSPAAQPAPQIARSASEDTTEILEPEDIQNILENRSAAKAMKRRPGRPRKNGAGEASSSAPAAPRRSKRLQEAKFNEAPDTSVAGPSKGKAKARRQRAVASSPLASSAKPQGVSKKKRATTTKRRTRKAN